jgi:hypothetical protein
MIPATAEVGAGTDAAWAVLTAAAEALAAGAAVLVPAADAPVPLVVTDAGWAAD